MVKGCRAGLLGAALALLWVLPVGLNAQSYVQPVWDQLQSQYEVADEYGYSTMNYVIGKINDDAEDSWTFYFDRDMDYIISAVCDNDCSDIDMVLSNDKGKEVASDTESDDTPVLEFSPPKSGSYKIVIKMYECSTNPCYYGIGIFWQ